MGEHTPGPWDDGIYHAVWSGGRRYAHIRSQGNLVPIAAVSLGVEGYGHNEGEANARLIAAAPDLLEKAAKYFAALDSEPENDCDDGDGAMFPSDWSHREHDKKIWTARAELRAALLKASPSQSSREG